jgi:peptide/nickel transport system substrate-binding protein
MNHQETPAGVVARNMFDTLLERDEQLVVRPALAAEMPRLVAPTVWEFKLRSGIRFHNGEPVDADAVKYSLERLVDPKLKLRGSPPFAPIDRVEIVDPLTVRIHTKVPWPILDTAMSAGQAAILPPKYYREKEAAFLARNPVGSGPYRFVRWVKDDRIEVEANEQYWRGAPRVKKLVFRPIPDDAVRVAALQNGEVDVAVNIPPHLSAVIANHPKLFLTTAPSVRTIQLLYYTHQYDAQHKLVGPYPGPTADRRVRQAMNYAVDVDDIIRTVLDGKATRVATMLTDKHFGFDPGLKPIKQDLAKSKQLLAEAGFPGGLEITLNSPQGRYIRDKEVAEALAGQLTKAGIRTTVRTHEWVHYFGTLGYNHRTGPVWLIGWGTSSYDAELVYVPMFRAGRFLSNYYNADFEGLIEQAQSTMDSKKRAELYHRINRIWADDAAAMPLYQQQDLYGASRRLTWKARGDELIKGYEMALRDGR